MESAMIVPLLVAVAATIGVVLRPFRTPDWAWAVLAAILLVAIRTVTPEHAVAAVLQGTSVYAFLAGIVILAELARRERVFEWLAEFLACRGGGSPVRLLLLTYAVGLLATIFLSNDTTVVALTPAVIAMMSDARIKPHAYLFACALVSNAASFALPISNPANLVLYAQHLPRAEAWLATYGASSLVAIVITLLGLLWVFRADLKEPYQASGRAVVLGPHGRLTAIVLCVAAVALAATAFLGGDVGYVALAVAIGGVLVVGATNRGAALAAIPASSWEIVPLVAGFFVIVRALGDAGAVAYVRAFFDHVATLGDGVASLAAGLAVTLASCALNNLPVARAVGTALASSHASAHLAHAALVAVDLGPNVSVSGSLATLLWLQTLRRNGIAVSPWDFLKVGLLTTVPALIAALLLVR